jgi:hypothetical protein
MRSRILSTGAHSTTIDMACDGLRIAMSHGIDQEQQDAITMIMEANWMGPTRSASRHSCSWSEQATKGSLFLIFVSLA